MTRDEFENKYKSIDLGDDISLEYSSGVLCLKQQKENGDQHIVLGLRSLFKIPKHLINFNEDVLLVLRGLP